MKIQRMAICHPDRKHRSRGMCSVCWSRFTKKKSRYKMSTKELARRESTESCELCGDRLKVPHIDHNHKCCAGRTTCGKCIRGTICDGCNRGLGFFKDDIERLRKAIAYLLLWK